MPNDGVPVDCHVSSIEDMAALLESNTEQGLSEQQVKDKLERFGKNRIGETKKVTLFELILRQFKSPIVYLLFFAVALSFWFKELLDAFAILIVLLINTAIGFYMEFQAQLSLLALKRLSAIQTKTIRNGRILEINSEDIVPGDILFVEAGDLIAADGRIFRPQQLLIDESALTGESVPVEKKEGVLPSETILGDRTNMGFKGTYVVKGNSYVLVCATGMNTELGKVAKLVQSAEQSATPLEKKLEQFSKKLIKITVALVILIFIAGLINDQPIMEMAKTAIALAVAAIPEGLPIVATMSLAQGMIRMARHKVIVKKLSAVETLGGTNVICTDKTGTLTQNKMEVVSVITPSGSWQKNKEFTGSEIQFDLIKKAAILCNTADLISEGNETKEIGDPLELALLKFAQSAGDDIEGIRKEYIKTAEEPFSSETRLMATAHQKNGERYVFAKGAAEEVLVRCSHIHQEEIIPLVETRLEEWKQKSELEASLGLRVIAFAYRKDAGAEGELVKDLVFLGLVSMVDPARPEVFDAINECKTAGIKVVMTTGDHPATAHYIAMQLGITKETDLTLLGKDLKQYEQLNEEEKIKWINTSVFARVNPKNKLDLVRVHQEKGSIVGMTGDGINDAPALKKADIGIAMGQKGTQVAQEVADMILKDDSFSSVVVAIRQGRIIFENIKKFVTYLLSCNLSELLVVATAAVMNFHFQLLPLQILSINLITDVLPALALGTIKGHADIMSGPPRKSSEPIINYDRWKLIFLYAAVMALASTGAVVFYHFNFHGNETRNVTVCNNILFFTLICCQLLHVFNMNQGKYFTSEIIRNKLVWLALIISLAILFGLIRIEVVRQALNVIPMTMREWIIIITAAFSSALIIQVLKYFFINPPRKNETSS